MDRMLRIKDLSFKNDEQYKLFLVKLLSCSGSKEEIDYILKLTNGFIDCLKFINDNCNTICKILEKNDNIFKYQKTITN